MSVFCQNIYISFYLSNHQCLAVYENQTSNSFNFSFAYKNWSLDLVFYQIFLVFVISLDLIFQNINRENREFNLLILACHVWKLYILHVFSLLKATFFPFLLKFKNFFKKTKIGFFITCQFVGALLLIIVQSNINIYLSFWFINLTTYYWLKRKLSWFIGNFSSITIKFYWLKGFDFLWLKSRSRIPRKLSNSLEALMENNIKVKKINEWKKWIV